MEPELRLLIWPNYINPLTIEQFRDRFGVAITLEIVPSAVELMERMREADAAIDVLVPPDYAVRELGAENRLLHLDHARLPNLEHLEPRFRTGRAHDPQSQISVIKDWGTTGIMYRSDMVSESPQSWQDFWTLAEKYSGRIVVLDSPGEVIGAALKMRSHSYNATSPEALAQARLDLLQLKPHLIFDTAYRPLLAEGKAALALGWNGDAAALIADGLPLRYVVPAEGSQLWEDDWAIAKNAPHPEAAHAFLNFVLQPEIAVQEANYTGYATANRTAFAMLTEAQQQDKTVYVSQAILDKLEQGTPYDEEGKQRRQQVWQEIRT